MPDATPECSPSVLNLDCIVGLVVGGHAKVLVILQHKIVLMISQVQDVLYLVKSP